MKYNYKNVSKLFVNMQGKNFQVINLFNMLEQMKLIVI